MKALFEKAHDSQKKSKIPNLEDFSDQKGVQQFKKAISKEYSPQKDDTEEIDSERNYITKEMHFDHQSIEEDLIS
jgi:hypothetical protein